ncbi:interleukin-31 receptor subunit alpha-like [Leuresthes tenuis]|uniref:interleukin-31 receptor subunit alpha-like n=1 Tax=Leuresthes tenuis TaxID=355514 RepID=UPI003B50C07E
MFPFFVPFIIVFISSICKGQHDNTCNVFPKDQYIEVGSSAKIFCQTSCVNGKVFWTLNNVVKINESLSNTINSTHTVLLLRNFTYPSATLQCHSAHKQVLGGTIIRTYSKPRNISCHFHYKSREAMSSPDLFTCRWEHQTNPSMKINYAVLVEQSPSVDNWKSEICMSNEPQCTSKDVTIVRNIFYSDKVPVVVIIRAETAAWEADSDPHEFYPEHTLKIYYPKVAVTAFSEYLLLKWDLGRLIPQKHPCQVKYTKASLSKGDTSKVLGQYLYFEGSWNTTIEVESCINYSISMRCALDNAPWSNWSPETTVLTKLNKKHVMPHLWRKVTELGKNGKRKVRVMWMDIPSTCKETMNYTIKQIALMTGNYISTSCSTSTCDVDVDQHAHRINLTVSHDEVVFTEESIYVPAIGETSLPEVTDIQTSTDEGVIVVSWKAPIQPVSGYIIDWTQNGSQYYWKESNFTNTTLDDLLDKKPYNITITPILDERTGHSTQALQICSRVGDPGNVKIKDVKFYDKSAIVSWETKSQDACSGAVISYMVFYKAQNGALNVTVGGKNYVLLEDLTPDTQYTVYVEAKAHTGKTRSKERIFRTTLFDTRLIKVLSICGGIIIVLVLSLGLFCAIQWKKCSEKPVPNPGLSSVAMWLSQSQQKDMCSFQPFNNPSEGQIDRVYTEETHKSYISSLAAGSTGNTAMDQIQEYSDSTMTPVPVMQKNSQAEPTETHFKSSPGEATAFISTESISVSPYRSQSSVETPVFRTTKHRKQASGKQPEKTTMKTMYVSLDMFEPAGVR